MDSVVFGTYTQRQLDAQYDNPAACPTYRQIADQTVRMSLEARQAASQLDVQWGDTERESLDVYRPAASTQPHPVVVYVHGGAWVGLDKESSAFATPAFTEQGVLFIAMGFHTAAMVPFSAMVRRLVAGIEWVHQNIARFGGDPSRIVLVGHSSGTHLVSQCLSHDWTAAGLDPSPFAGAVLISGLCDLEPCRLSYRNKRLQLTPGDVQSLSLKHQRVLARCPIYVFVAEHDTDEFRRQSRDMADIFRRYGTLRQSVMVSQRNHFDINLDLADSRSELHGAVMSLVNPAG